MQCLSGSFIYFGISCLVLVSGQSTTNSPAVEPSTAAPSAQAVSIPRNDAVGLDEQYSTFCNRSEIERYKGSCAKQTKDSKEIIHRIKEQNKILKESVLLNLIRAHVIPVFQPVEGFKLMDKTLNIFRKMCPILSKTFLNRVELLYKSLNYRLASTRTDFFKEGSKHFEWINSILDKCMNGSTKMEFTLNKCKDTILSPKANSTAFICTKLSEETNPRLYDPILDAIWLIINAIRSGCFHFFHESYEMWHNYFVSLMDTFSSPIQMRWTSQLEDLKFWKRILGPNYESDLANVERCSKYIINDSELGKYSMSSARGLFIPYVRLEGTH